jgi:hypothetical protein
MVSKEGDAAAAGTGEGPVRAEVQPVRHLSVGRKSWPSCKVCSLSSIESVLEK